MYDRSTPRLFTLYHNPSVSGVPFPCALLFSHVVVHFVAHAVHVVSSPARISPVAFLLIRFAEPYRPICHALAPSESLTSYIAPILQPENLPLLLLAP